MPGNCFASSLHCEGCIGVRAAAQHQLQVQTLENRDIGTGSSVLETDARWRYCTYRCSICCHHLGQRSQEMIFYFLSLVCDNHTRSFVEVASVRPMLALSFLWLVYAEQLLRSGFISSQGRPPSPWPWPRQAPFPHRRRSRRECQWTCCCCCCRCCCHCRYRYRCHCRPRRGDPPPVDCCVSPIGA